MYTQIEVHLKKLVHLPWPCCSVGCSAVYLWILGQGAGLGCGFRPCSGHRWEATNGCFSLRPMCLHPHSLKSISMSLDINQPTNQPTNLRNRNSIRRREKEDSEQKGQTERGPESHSWMGRDSQHGGPCGTGHSPRGGSAQRLRGGGRGREQPTTVNWESHRTARWTGERQETGTVLHRPLQAVLRGGRRAPP
ncbi:hypothetical protein HJG60_011575 [Phyllostomus discolor]|uniref:Uncharacterized protein n=1 Tax=Phyllostomus discolor TaxID=89673 RepID=A0A834E0X9_9CHIR|nr:hypothetical protein HJG60_011575 [Phyllostomus discolor]